MSDLIHVRPARIDLISRAGKQGPPGATGQQGVPGPAGGTTTTYTAGSAIGGHRVVVLGTDGKLAYASATDQTHIGRIIGITTTAADPNTDCQVQSFDQMTEPSWNWDLTKPIYLGANGLLTQIVPAVSTAVFSLVLGFPITSTTMFVNIREPIILN